MYRFTDDLELSHLLGCELIQVCIDPYNLFFNFEPQNQIHIEGRWRVLDSGGKVVDEGDHQTPKDAYRVHLLVGQKICQFRIPNPRLLVVVFDNRWTLEIHDDSDQYECCYISPNIYI